MIKFITSASMRKSPRKTADNNTSDSGKARSSRETLIAQVATKPTFLAANTIRTFNHVVGQIDLMSMADELEEQVSSLHKGDLSRAEDTLAAQAIVLDTLFNTLATKALKAPGLANQAVLLKLALQSQKQCCQTLEALAAVKNPPAVTVLRQTNIGRAVQINNRSTDAIPEANLENELLENNHGQRLDTGAQSAPIPTHSNLAAVEKRHRAKDSKRKSQVMS